MLRDIRRSSETSKICSELVLNSIFTIFALRPSSSVIQSPMSAFSSALPSGEIQLTASRSKSSSSTPRIVNLPVSPFLSLIVTVAPNVTLFDARLEHLQHGPMPEFAPIRRCARYSHLLGEV